MSRRMKIGLSIGGATACILYLLFLWVQAAAVKGFSAAPEAFNLWGWVQNVIAALGAMGFTGATAWAFIQKNAATVVKIVDPNASDEKIANIVNFTRIGALMEWIDNCPDGPTKEAAKATGRAACTEFSLAVFGPEIKP